MREDNVETIDIVPTIADVLMLSPVRDFDGHSLLSSEPNARAEKHILGGGAVTKLPWPGEFALLVPESAIVSGENGISMLMLQDP